METYYERFVFTHQDVERETRQKFSDEINTVENGIELLLLAEAFLGDRKFDYSTPDLATRTLIMRFHMSMPTTSYWALLSAIQGQYRISMSIARTFMEEVISVKYYEMDRTRAFDLAMQAENEAIPREQKMSRKFRGAGLSSDHQFSKLYETMSEAATHANTLTTMFEEKSEGDRTMVRAEEPSFKPNAFRYIARLLATLLYIANGLLFRAFPELDKNKEIMEKAKVFSNDVDKRYPEEIPATES